MKSPLDKPKDLLLAVQAAQDAKEDLDHAWRMGEFQKLLRSNMHLETKSLHLLVSDDPDYPRLRCFRGTGYSLRLRSATVHKNENPPVVSLYIDAEWVSREVDPMEESEGCPGAPTKTIRHHLIVPLPLMEKLNQKDFIIWARKEAARQRSQLKQDAMRKIEDLAAKAGLTVSFLKKTG